MAMVSINELRAGDVLLGYKDSKLNPVGKCISHITDSKYTHAAICIDSCTAAESTPAAGVTKTNLHDFVERYDHIAAFRQPDAWQPPTRVQALNAFINSVIASRAKYNLREVVSFKKRSEVHQLSLTDQLHAFFAGNLAPAPVEKGRYFCSELVADCFVATGFIDPSAAVVYKSNVTSPGSLGRDPTFGTFLGYVSVVPNYSVPDSDEFLNTSTFSEIFGNADE